MNPLTYTLYFIVSFAALAVVFAMHAGAQISRDLLIETFIIPTTIIIFTLLLISLSYMAKRVIVKKNFLRISLLLLASLFIGSFTLRIIEAFDNIICYICLTATILYFILFLLGLIISKQLYKLVQKVFN